MKHLQPFVLFEAQKTSGLTPDQEGFLTKYTTGTWSVNPTTGLVDIQGDFNCNFRSLKNLSVISFGHVNGNFHCYENRLTSLVGAPQTVNGDFYCFNNQLTSLVGAPQTVDGEFNCSYNDLTSLEGSPRTVGGDFYCFNNQLTSLVGAPQTVDGEFNCSYNDLTSLEGSPQTVDGDFNCYYNQMTSLEGAPRTVGGDFYCHHNQLTSLEGAPQTVGGKFYCDLFELKKGEWNMEGWAEVLNTGTEEAKKLILTLPWLQPEYWNNKLKEEPKATILQIVPIWDYLPSNIRDEIQIPSNWKDSFDNLLDLQRAGIF